MPFGRWMRLVGWRHVVAVVMIVWALFPVFYVISLSFSGRQDADRGLPAGPQRVPGARAAWCRTSSTSATTSTLLTSDQYPFVTWIKNSLILATVNSGAALLMGAARRTPSAGCGSRAAGWACSALMLVQMFPAVLAITAVYLLLTADPRRLPDVRPRVASGARC